VRVLAGDIGGTKTAIAIVEMGPRSLEVRRLERYPSADHAGLEDILKLFLRSERTRPPAAGFGVAGPVRQGAARITNLPWKIDARRIARVTGIRRVVLQNDFVSSAMGLRFLRPAQLVTLSRGRPEPGAPIAILGAGTGLGQAVVATVRGHDVVVASEGGHVDFGPADQLQDRLVAFLRRELGRVSRETVLSGPGLVRLYEFLARDGEARESPEVGAAFEAEGDRAAVISRFGLAGDSLCQAALGLFVSIYGSEAGNAALQYRATGGVYLAGGIASKILPALRGPGFLTAFRTKPPMEKLLAAIPVRVVRDARVGLFGAAAAAYRRTIETTRPSSTTRVRRTRL
jgi:glucokinase